jgi:hypothetical protein
MYLNSALLNSINSTALIFGNYTHSYFSFDGIIFFSDLAELPIGSMSTCSNLLVAEIQTR